MTAKRLVVMGASLGGLAAVSRVIRDLPVGDYAVALVQHRMRDPSQRLVSLLQDRTALSVVEASAACSIEPGHLYVAPPDYHLLVDEGSFEVDVDEPVSSARPSIDVLFESAAEAWAGDLMAVLLTASSRDGIRGLETVRERGGRVLVQDPDDAEASEAVRYAVEALCMPSATAEGIGTAIGAWGHRVRARSG